MDDACRLDTLTVDNVVSNTHTSLSCLAADVKKASCAKDLQDALSRNDRYFYALLVLAVAAALVAVLRR